MDNQTAFNKSVQYFCNPDFQPSYDPETNGCYYRHPSGDGRRCVVGNLIPDDQYHKDIEWRSAGELALGPGDTEEPGQHYPPVLLNLSMAMLEDLQGLHDGLAEEASITEPTILHALKTIQEKYGLENPVW